MSDKDMLEKAIRKAIDGGWGPWNAPIIVQSIGDDLCCEIGGERWNIEAILFNHDFAKALWPDGSLCTCGELHNMLVLEATSERTSRLKADTRNYRHHLQEMVVSKDPIKYLGENIRYLDLTTNAVTTYKAMKPFKMLTFSPLETNEDSIEVDDISSFPSTGLVMVFKPGNNNPSGQYMYRASSQPNKTIGQRFRHGRFVIFDGHFFYRKRAK